MGKRNRQRRSRGGVTRKRRWNREEEEKEVSATRMESLVAY
jgi:hypothetical protein